MRNGAIEVDRISRETLSIRPGEAREILNQEFMCLGVDLDPLTTS